MKKQNKRQNVIVLSVVAAFAMAGCGGGGVTDVHKECLVKQVWAILEDSASVNVQGYGKSPVLEIDGNRYSVSTTELIDFDKNLSVANLPTDAEYNATLTYTKADDTTESCWGTVVTKTPVVPDTQKPVINLVGDGNITLNIGDTYTEQGATVTDNVDTGLTATIGGDTVDTSTAGTYVVTYSATDSAGNVADVVRRTVSVVEVPNTAPTAGNTSVTANSDTADIDVSWLINDPDWDNLTVSIESYLVTSWDIVISNVSANWNNVHIEVSSGSWDAKIVYKVDDRKWGTDTWEIIVGDLFKLHGII